MVVDVVDRDIPLLISKQEMKERKFTLHLHNDTLSVDGVEHKLNTTSNGHLKLPLWNQHECNICFDDMNEKEKVHTLKVLHRQFRHQPASVTEEILRNAEVITPQIKRLNNDIAALPHNQ